MRKALDQLDHKKRYTFIGRFERFGKKTAFRGPDITTVLLKDIHLKGNSNILTDHLWFSLTKEFKQQCLHPGDEVQFDGRVDTYVKGYFGYREIVYVPEEVDVKITFPTKIFNLTHPVAKPKRVKRTHEEVEKERIEKEEARKLRQEREEHPERFYTNEPTYAQMDYIKTICNAGNLKLAEYIDTFDKATAFLNAFVPTYKKWLGQARSTDTFTRVQLTIDKGLSMDEALKQLQISASTYRKYKDRAWLKQRTKIDWETPSREYIMELMKLELQSEPTD